MDGRTSSPGVVYERRRHGRTAKHQNNLCLLPTPAAAPGSRTHNRHAPAVALGGCLYAKSGRQKLIISTSTTEAEFANLTPATKQAIWMTRPESSLTWDTTDRILVQFSCSTTTRTLSGLPAPLSSRHMSFSAVRRGPTDRPTDPDALQTSPEEIHVPAAADSASHRR